MNIPSGIYLVKAVTAEVMERSDGKNLLQIKLEMLEGPYKGDELYLNILPGTDKWEESMLALCLSRYIDDFNDIGEIAQLIYYQIITAYRLNGYDTYDINL